MANTNTKFTFFQGLRDCLLMNWLITWQGSKVSFSSYPENTDMTLATIFDVPYYQWGLILTQSIDIWINRPL